MTEKIFCIGMQKTGTSSLHYYFLESNLKSDHNAMWWYYKDINYFQKFDCFTDGFENVTKETVFPDLKFLENNFQNSKFILQTRSLKNWLLSRLRHGVDVYLNPFKIKEFNDEVLLFWVKNRNIHHYNVTKYFENCKEKLLVLDIEEEGIEKKLKKFLNLQNNIKFDKINEKLNYQFEKEKILSNKIDNFLKKYIVEEDYNTKHIARLKEKP